MGRWPSVHPAFTFHGDAVCSRTCHPIQSYYYCVWLQLRHDHGKDGFAGSAQRLRRYLFMLEQELFSGKEARVYLERIRGLNRFTTWMEAHPFMGVMTMRLFACCASDGR